jgi:hypothetical protein
VREDVRAPVRQAEEGRLSVLYTDDGVTDPAASGEAVLRAARVPTGDAELKVAADRMLGYLLDGPFARRTARSTTRAPRRDRPSSS